MRAPLKDIETNNEYSPLAPFFVRQPASLLSRTMVTASAKAIFASLAPVLLPMQPASLMGLTVP